MVKKILKKNIVQKRLFLLIFLIVLSAVFKLLMPNLFSAIIDLSRKNVHEDKLIRYTICGVLLAILTLITSISLEKCRLYLSLKLTASFYKDILKTLYRKDVIFS